MFKLEIRWTVTSRKTPLIRLGANNGALEMISPNTALNDEYKDLHELRDLILKFLEMG